MNTPLVTAQWLYDNLHNPELIILDASPQANVSGLESEFSDIRISGARAFNLKKDFSDIQSDLPNMLPSPAAFEKGCRELGIDNASKIVIYDNLGVYISPRVWWMFRSMGHEQVAVLNGGLPEWGRQGFPMEAIEKQTFAPGNFTAEFRPEMIRDFSFVSDNIDSHYYCVIDARSKGRFEGTAPEPRAGLRSGSIPNSVNLPFAQVLENGKYKSKEELINIFKELNPIEKPLVFSCGSGLTACIILLASELVAPGEKSVYDGSWTEWAQRVTVE